MTSSVSNAHVAQLVEHVLGKDEVTRSIRVVGSMQGLLDLKTYLKGPTGVVIGYDDPVLPTKVLKDFISAEKRDQKIRMTAGVLEGKILQPAELAAVAKLPKKEVLIAMLLSAMQGPIRGVVYTLSAVLSKFVRVIAAIQDKRKGEGDMPATEGKLSQEELIKAIEGMSVLDLAELVKGLEARFGVTAAAPVAMAAQPYPISHQAPSCSQSWHS
jgi:large subunit ribosomal protein L7/L12